MGSASKASWVVAMSIGAVEALKDQGGLCRWNYPLRSLLMRCRTAAQASRIPSSTDAKTRSGFAEKKMKQSEESLRKVMFLSTWGPN